MVKFELHLLKDSADMKINTLVSSAKNMEPRKKTAALIHPMMLAAQGSVDDPMRQKMMSDQSRKMT